MALFSDGPIATLSDLRAYDSAVLDVAATEQVDAGAKIAVSQTEMQLELQAFLRRRGLLEGLHSDLRNIVVTDALKHTHVMWSLARIYQDALNAHVNERYKAKAERYEVLARNAFRQLLAIGLSITHRPIAKPEVPKVDLLAGSLLPAAAYCIRAAAMGSFGVSGAWSDPVWVSTNPGMLLQVRFSGDPGPAGWVVYAGTEEGALKRQNELPIAAGNVWLQDPYGLRHDLPAIAVQAGDYTVCERHELLRG